MINKNLIPQIVIDYADKMLNDKNVYVRQNFLERIETIKDFCDKVIFEYKHPKRK